MDAPHENMDIIRALVENLARWTSTHPAPPVIWAAHQKTRSLNGPSTYASLVFQEEAVCAHWEFGERRHAFPPGRLALVSTHLGSRSAEPRNGRGLWICAFDLDGWEQYPHFLERWTWSPRPVRAPVRLVHAYRELIYHYPLRARGGGLHFKAALLRLLATVLDELESPAARPVSPGENVGKALAFLHAHYADPRIDLARTAAAAGLSPHHFGRVFRARMGRPPMQYLQALRVNQARSLLLNTDLRVNEVAREVGFTDPLHFSRVFRRLTGRSPRQTRQGRP